MYFEDRYHEEKSKSTASIISGTYNGNIICAASARISTTQGSALEIVEKSENNSNNSNLITKVLSSGHKSIVEHFCFNVVFNNVSVFVEQFLIEFRLASFTVQSRRYVDFRNAGFVIPKDLSAIIKDRYINHINYLFDTYEKLVDCGIPKEDARFVLPYCFKSNFYCTCNARELSHIICTMIYGRGKFNDEVNRLGTELKAQFDEYFPGIIEKEKSKYETDDMRYTYDYDRLALDNPRIVSQAVELVSYTQNAKEIVTCASSYNNAIQKADMDLRDLILSERPRELELLNYSFKIRNISLSAVTHLARHRMQSLLVPNVFNALINNKFIIPASITESEDTQELYRSAFENNTKIAEELLLNGMEKKDLVYLALSGHTLDVMMNMNGRELLHYIGLRCCNRAQWEIRDISDNMLKTLRNVDNDIFKYFGPNCFIKGHCPEGKMSCGRMEQVLSKYKM